MAGVGNQHAVSAFADEGLPPHPAVDAGSRHEEDERGPLPLCSIFSLCISVPGFDGPRPVRRHHGHELPPRADLEQQPPHPREEPNCCQICCGAFLWALEHEDDDQLPSLGGGAADVLGMCCVDLVRGMTICAGWALALQTCLQCSQCMSVSGLFSCFSCILQPFVCVWDWIRGQIGYMRLVLFALQCAWQCVQFWTPLSVTVLILWLFYRPDRFHPYVNDAVLTDLDLTTHDGSNTTASHLRYDLTVDLSFRNSHSRLSIRYLDVGATVFYNGTKLGPAINSLPRFRQPPKNTTLWQPVFQGTVAVFSREAAAELERERAAGVLHLRVGVDMTLMYKVFLVENVVFYKYDCWLWFSTPRKEAPALFHGDGTWCWRV